MFNSGFVPSLTYGASTFTPTPNSTIPESYSLVPELAIPFDQGNENICVSICTTDMIRYAQKVCNKKYRKKENFFFKKRADKWTDGMSPREAFQIAQEFELASSYAILRTETSTRVSIVANGPALIGLPVYNFGETFWKPSSEGSTLQGYHAVTLVGYDNETRTFTLRNSWGIGWGTQGYTQFPYEDYNIITEAWTLFR